MEIAEDRLCAACPRSGSGPLDVPLVSRRAQRRDRLGRASGAAEASVLAAGPCGVEHGVAVDGQRRWMRWTGFCPGRSTASWAMDRHWCYVIKLVRAILIAFASAFLVRATR